MRERVTDVVVLDRSANGREGPWSTFARMHTLRTPKSVTGPDLGIPSLSARAWYEAKFGARAWDKLGKIPRDLWQEYLLWLRETIGISVKNHTEVIDIEPIASDVLSVHLRDVTTGVTLPRLLTRKVVLATGIEGYRALAGAGHDQRGVAARALCAHRRCNRLFAVDWKARRSAGCGRVGLRQCRGRTGARCCFRRSYRAPPGDSGRQSQPLDGICEASCVILPISTMNSNGGSCRCCSI